MVRPILTLLTAYPKYRTIQDVENLNIRHHAKIITILILPLLGLLFALAINADMLQIYSEESLSTIFQCDHKELPEHISITPLDSSIIAEIVSTTVVQNNLTKDNAFQILNSTVRIGSGNNTGTGVIIWSGSIENGEHYNYVITNFHVVGNADAVNVEKFNYINNRDIGETSSYEGKIVAKDSIKDLALIEIRAPRPIGNVSKFITLAEYRQMSLYDSIFVCGCSLGSTPSITNGNISAFGKDLHIVSAFAIFGNSGGGVFTSDGKIFGLANRISAVRVGEGRIPEPNITRVIPSSVTTKWIDARGYSFILDEDLEVFKNFLDARNINPYFQ